jgi:vitamin K-dependent gamma-carboxylase
MLLCPIDGAWLAAFRVLIGTLLGVALWRFEVNGWVDELLLAPRFHFKYWGFEWVEPLPAAAMHRLFHLLAGLGVCVAAGIAFRLTAPAFALGFSYVQLIDVSTYLNHYYLAALLCWLLAISPAGRVWSIDAWILWRWRRRSRGRGEPETRARPVSAAWLWLFRVQVGVVYSFAGLAKAQSDWLLHGQPLRIWLGQRTSLPLIGPLFAVDPVPLLLSWAGLLLDTTIVAWLSWSKTRPWAYLVVFVFHAMTRLLFNIGMFPAIMVAAALVFFSPAWPRIALSRLATFVRRRPASPLAPPPEAEAAPRARGWQRWGLALGAAYCALQLLLPLRHWLYGGNVLWHEQGMRFSWRVMVRVKGGGTTFVVREPSGHEWRVSPRDYLTARQEAEMSSQPDLILQLAHHIERDFAARGRGPVEVRAESMVTLNGRRSVPIIDPRVDLTAVRDGVRPASWVLPAPASSPPHTRPVL